jgi:hypothetical protein
MYVKNYGEKKICLAKQNGLPWQGFEATNCTALVERLFFNRKKDFHFETSAARLPME